MLQVAERQAGRKVMVDTGGASGGGFDARSGQHEFSWRDAMDIPVRWRQLSEPNDQVCSVPYAVLPAPDAACSCCSVDNSICLSQWLKSQLLL